MAITTSTVELIECPPDRTEPASAGFASADLTGCESILAAPGASKHIYVNKIMLTSAAAENVDIGSGEATNAVETKYFPDIQTGAGLTTVLEFAGKWWKLPANKALTIDADSSGVVSGYVVAVKGSA